MQRSNRIGNDLRSHDVRTILEVGSHVGSFTLMAHHYWPSARIVAVEPFWTQVTDFGIDVVDLIKLDCEGAEYLIISALSAPRGDECGTSDLDRALKIKVT
jgi:hypothetical protein